MTVPRKRADPTRDGHRTNLISKSFRDNLRGDAVAVLTTMDAPEWLCKHLEDDGSDVLREMIKSFAEQLMAADVDAMCGAGYGERSPARVNSRNGYRERPFDTRAGTIALAIPKLRRGSYFPHWLLEPAAGRAGPHTGRVPVLSTASRPAGSTTSSRPWASRASRVPGVAMAQSLDATVGAFRTRPLTPAPGWSDVDAGR